MNLRPQLKTLSRLQAGSLGFVLIRCGQLLNERGIARLNAAAGKPMMREAHSRLIPHLQSPKGIRITELARRIGITKQAAQQLVSDLIEEGVVRLDPDPIDARAKRVRLTKSGVLTVIQGTKTLVDIDTEVAALLGKKPAKQLHQLLRRLLPVIEVPSVTSESLLPK